MVKLLVIILAYLLGSIPFGYLIVRTTAGGDIRETGSGGTGATNVSRRAGRGAGVLTLVLDAIKGAAAVIIASWIVGVPIFSGNPILNFEHSIAGAYWTVAAASIAVIVGHMFPVWLGFRGGKGVATGVGVFLVLAPWAVVVAAIAFFLIVWRTRYVSLGSMVAAAMIPVVVWTEGLFMLPARFMFAPLLTAAVVGAGLIIFAHRGNIERLVQGTENKF